MMYSYGYPCLAMCRIIRPEASSGAVNQPLDNVTLLKASRLVICPTSLWITTLPQASRNWLELVAYMYCTLLNIVLFSDVKMCSLQSNSFGDDFNQFLDFVTLTLMLQSLGLHPPTMWRWQRSETCAVWRWPRVLNELMLDDFGMDGPHASRRPAAQVLEQQLGAVNGHKGPGSILP